MTEAREPLAVVTPTGARPISEDADAGTLGCLPGGFEPTFQD
jgi:hypothetical protein